MNERERVAFSCQKMGYWETERSDFSARRAEVLAHCQPLATDERTSVLAYMDAADVGISWRGSATCRLCSARLGSRCMVTPDLKWRFPEGWQHYILKHDLRPTDPAFVLDAVAWFTAGGCTTRVSTWHESMLISERRCGLPAVEAVEFGGSTVLLCKGHVGPFWAGLSPGARARIPWHEVKA